MRKGRSSSRTPAEAVGPRQHEFNTGVEALGTKGSSPSARGKPLRRAAQP